MFLVSLSINFQDGKENISGVVSMHALPRNGETIDFHLAGTILSCEVFDVWHALPRTEDGACATVLATYDHSQVELTDDRRASLAFFLSGKRPTPADYIPDQLRDVPVADIVPSRIRNRFLLGDGAGMTVSDLISLGPARVVGIRNLGTIGYQNLIEALEEKGVKLAPQWHSYR